MLDRIIQAKYDHLDDCVLALQNSELGRVYFSEENKANKAINDGIAKEEILVATDEQGLCLGFLWFIPYGAFHGFPYLHIIAVKEEYRNLGIGNKLLKYYEEVITDSSKIFLVVSDFNPKAKKLYEKLGYIEVGVIPNLYKSGVTEFLMMKELD